MTKLSLDTHLLIWWLNGDPNLPQAVVRCVRAKNQEVYFSQISLWEMAIKKQLKNQEGRKKLTLKVELDAVRQRILLKGFHWLHLQDSHILKLRNLTKSGFYQDHKDLFDRLLIAQGQEEQMKCVTCDSKLERFNVLFYPKGGRDD